ncbi:hypothetical protein STENM223S_03004 [Streptomyces tendae]
MDCDAHAYRPVRRVRPADAAGPRPGHPHLGDADGRLPDGDDFIVHFDIPGIDPETIELDVERNVLRVRAERRSPAPENADLVITERPTGEFTRQLFLGDTLDTERIDATYEAGVLTLRIPVAEAAKPRRIQITGGDSRKQITG